MKTDNGVHKQIQDPGGIEQQAPAAFDVVVIGGGLAGLVAAATAARAGASVGLADRRSFGGRARSVERDGFVLNDGAHALYRGGGGWAVLESLGVHPKGVAPELSSYRVLWDGEIARLPLTPGSILATRLLSTRSKIKLGRWFNDLSGAADKAGDITLDEWLTDERARSDLRRFVLTVARLVTYAAQPEELPAAVVLNQLGLDGGVVYLHGGWQSLIDGLVGAAGLAGVTLLDGRGATSLDRYGDRWAVGTAAGPLAASAVILAAGGPQLAVNLLGDDPAGWIERAGPAQRAACLDVGGRSGDVSFLLSADSPLYLSMHAPVADLAPDGQSLYSIMRYLAADDDTPAVDNRAALEEHAARAGLPPVGDRLINRFLAAPTVTWGSPQVGIERPSGLELAERGLYAAGDWVGRPLLADASIVSGSKAGFEAARRVMVRT